MEILTHRGYWEKTEDQNTLQAFEKSLSLNMGIETDLRDYNGKIVISHDPPKEGSSPELFESLLKLMNGRNLCLALNIKSDGLAEEIKNILNTYNHTNYFAFDMSIPDMRNYLNHKLNIYTGVSDILTQPVFFEDSSGIWLDSFYTDWFDHKVIQRFLQQGKQVCIVSPELHFRDHSKQWEKVLKSTNLNLSSLKICTDYPDLAKAFFGGKNGY